MHSMTGSYSFVCSEAYLPVFLADQQSSQVTELWLKKLFTSENNTCPAWTRPQQSCMPAVLLLGKFLLQPRALQAFSFIYQDMENFGFGDGGEWVKGSLTVLCPESEAIWQYIQVGAASARMGCLTVIPS